MALKIHLKGTVMPTVLVVLTLMSVIVLGILMLWDTDFLFFSRLNYIKTQRMNIESVFTLYENDPNIISTSDTFENVILYESLPSSEMLLRRSIYGLYEIVTVKSKCGKVSRSRVLGMRKPWKKKCSLWYLNDNSALMLTGETHIKGRALLPQNGVQYGQMQSVFFSGNKLDAVDIGISGKSMPDISREAQGNVDRLFGLSAGQIIETTFEKRDAGFNDDTLIIETENEVIFDCALNGNIILLGNTVYLDKSSTLSDIIVVADKVYIGDEFRGNLQVFARDSIMAGNDVRLEYPSGLYSRKHIEIGERGEVNGYVIVDHTEPMDRKKHNGRIARSAKVRGMVWSSGIIQLQGVVNGSVFLNKAAYYSPHGVYQNTLYDVTVLNNDIIAFPVWLDHDGKRKSIKCLN